MRELHPAEHAQMGEAFYEAMFRQSQGFLYIGCLFGFIAGAAAASLWWTL